MTGESNDPFPDADKAQSFLNYVSQKRMHSDDRLWGNIDYYRNAINSAVVASITMITAVTTILGVFNFQFPLTLFSLVILVFPYLTMQLTSNATKVVQRAYEHHLEWLAMTITAEKLMGFHESIPTSYRYFQLDETFVLPKLCGKDPDVKTEVPQSSKEFIETVLNRPESIGSQIKKDFHIYYQVGDYLFIFSFILCVIFIIISLVGLVLSFLA